MRAEYVRGNVRAPCPGCNGSVSTFEFREAAREFGYAIRDGVHGFRGNQYIRIIYRLLRCAGCGRGGLATIHDKGQEAEGVLEDFYPFSLELAPLPGGIPEGVVSEYREAELCASFGAWRAASALLRSALEKTLRANGYVKGSLESRIEEAASHGVITAARQRRAHENVRVLGNDILHDEWREVTEEEYEAGHRYVQRILEDFYDQRVEVEAILKKAQLKKPSE